MFETMIEHFLFFYCRLWWQCKWSRRTQRRPNMHCIWLQFSFQFKAEKIQSLSFSWNWGYNDKMDSEVENIQSKPIPFIFIWGVLQTLSWTWHCSHSWKKQKWSCENKEKIKTFSSTFAPFDKWFVEFKIQTVSDNQGAKRRNYKRQT